VPATAAVTPAHSARLPGATPLMRSAAIVGWMCQMPNTPLVTAIAAGAGSTRPIAACSTPRNAVSSHSTVPAGMRTVTW
jgi:hypothetical protein